MGSGGSGPKAWLSVVFTYITSAEKTKRSYRPQMLTKPPKLSLSMTSENDFSTPMVGARRNGDTSPLRPAAHI